MLLFSVWYANAPTRSLSLSFWNNVVNNECKEEKKKEELKETENEKKKVINKKNSVSTCVLHNGFICIDQQVAANLVVTIEHNCHSAFARRISFKYAWVNKYTRKTFSYRFSRLNAKRKKKKEKKKKTMRSLNACMHYFISKRESEGCVGGQIDNNVVGRKWKNNDDLSSSFFSN
jgi:hypothetical protein